MRVLGISAFYHDSAAALVEDDRIAAAAQEERFTRKKHDPSFPTNAIAYCLQEANIRLDELDYVVFYDKPFLKFERLLETYVAMAPRGFRSFKMAIPLWLREKLFQKSLLRGELKKFGDNFDWKERLLFCEHHLSHAASAFFPSPYRQGGRAHHGRRWRMGDHVGRDRLGQRLEIFQEIHFPHSLGLLYSAFTYYTGFKVNSGEYKVMGLAPYGEPKYAKLILDNLIDLKPDGSFRLDMSYFDYCAGLTMTNARFSRAFRRAGSRAGELLTPFHMDIAASIQAVLEEAVLRLTRIARQTNRSAQSLPCRRRGAQLRRQRQGAARRQFENIWIQPAAGDAGGAVGAALAAVHLYKGHPRRPNGGDGMAGALLGPSFIAGRHRASAWPRRARDSRVVSEDMMVETAAEALAAQKAVGWFQGRMEFGPRSLGARSILGDPRSPTMQRNLNLKIKYRESFRPFAPAVLREDVADWFELESDSPYMLLVADVRKDRRRSMTAEEQALFGIDKLNVARSEIPAVTHVDYSARIQTVHANTNPLFHRLLAPFQGENRLPGAGQHELQRARRADRLHAGRCVPLFHGQ